LAERLAEDEKEQAGALLVSDDSDSTPPGG